MLRQRSSMRAEANRLANAKGSGMQLHTYLTSELRVGVFRFTF